MKRGETWFTKDREESRMTREQREVELEAMLRTPRGRAEIIEIHDRISGNWGTLGNVGTLLSGMIPKILNAEFTPASKGKS